MSSGGSSLRSAPRISPPQSGQGTCSTSSLSSQETIKASKFSTKTILKELVGGSGNNQSLHKVPKSERVVSQKHSVASYPSRLLIGLVRSTSMRLVGEAPEKVLNHRPTSVQAMPRSSTPYWQTLIAGTTQNLSLPRQPPSPPSPRLIQVLQLALPSPVIPM